MAKDEKFMFYETFIKAIDILPEEKRAEACYKFCRYGIYGELPEDESLKMFCIGVSCSVKKYHGCGGNHNPTGKNQHTKGGQVGQVGQNEQTQTKTKTETQTQTQTETQTETKIDYLTNPIINQVFSIYQTHCNNLTGLGKYYKRDVELKKLVGLYLEQTESNLEYFTQVCDIANKLVKIGSCKLDLKMVMNNHSGIYNGKYAPQDNEEDDGYSSHDDSEWIKKLEQEEPETWKVLY